MQQHVARFVQFQSKIKLKAFRKANQRSIELKTFFMKVLAASFSEEPSLIK